jgi:predicted RNase H-like HicB family nuclease
MRKVTFNNVIWKEGKVFVSRCLDNDVSSFGKTKKEALQNLQEALELYYDDFDFTTSIVSSIQNPELVQSIFKFNPNYAKVFAE